METNFQHSISNLMIIQYLLERLHKGWLRSSWSETFNMIIIKLWIALVVVSVRSLVIVDKEVEASGDSFGVAVPEPGSTVEPRKKKPTSKPNTTKLNSTKTTKPNKTTKRTSTTKRTTTSKSSSNSSPGYYPNNNINCDIDYNEYLEVDIMPIEPDPVVMPIEIDYAQYLKVCGGSFSIHSSVPVLAIMTTIFIFSWKHLRPKNIQFEVKLIKLSSLRRSKSHLFVFFMFLYFW